LAKVEKDILIIRGNREISSVDTLTQVLLTILEQLEESRRLLSVILNFLVYLSKSDISPDSQVRRRTIRVRHILASVVIEGIRAGEFAPINVRVADDLLYGLLESAIFRLVVLKRSSVEELKQAATLAVGRLRVK
jgi:hypothetical protein